MRKELCLCFVFYIIAFILYYSAKGGVRSTLILLLSLQRHFAAAFCSNILQQRFAATLLLCMSVCCRSCSSPHHLAAILLLYGIILLHFEGYNLLFAGGRNELYVPAGGGFPLRPRNFMRCFTVLHCFFIILSLYASLVSFFHHFFHHFVTFSIILSLYGLVTLTHKSYISSRNTIKCEFAPVLPNFHSGSVGKLG